MDQNQQPQQNQTPPPDYNFILNQGQPAPGMPPQPKKRNKKVIILIVLVILVVITLGVVLFLPDRRSPSSQSTETTNSQQTEPRTTSAVSTVQAYFNYVMNRQSTQAYDLLTETHNEIPQQFFDDIVIEAYTTNIDLARCAVRSQSAQADVTDIVYVCPTKDGARNMIFSLKVISANGNYKIDSYEMGSEAL